MKPEELLKNPKYRFSIQISVLIILIALTLTIFMQFKEVNRKGLLCQLNPFQYEAERLERQYNISMDCYCNAFGQNYNYGTRYRFNSTYFEVLK